MVRAFRESSSYGRDLNVIALRSRIYSSTKLFSLVCATMMSSLLPSTIFAQNVVAARPPVSSEALALHLRAKRPLSFATAKLDVSSASDSGFNSDQKWPVVF